jgi:transposase
MKWDAAERIMERAVERGLAKRNIEGVKVVGLDEKSFGKGHNYISIMTDLEHPRVLEVTPGNDMQSARALWQTLPEQQRNQVQAAAMDMSAGFAAATRHEAPQAVIVHDKFHVAKMLNEAVDHVRRREHRQLRQQNDHSLSGSRYLWLRDPKNLSEARIGDFQALLLRNLKTSRAWFYKENFQDFWRQENSVAGKAYFTRWYAGAIRCRIEPIKKSRQMPQGSPL